MAKEKRKDESNAREENRCRRERGGERYGTLGKRLARNHRRGRSGSMEERDGREEVARGGGEEEAAERGREEAKSEEARAKRGPAARTFSPSRTRIEPRAPATTIRSQGRSLLLPQSGDLSGMYYPSSRARYDDPSSLLFHGCRPFAARCK